MGAEQSSASSRTSASTRQHERNERKLNLVVAADYCDDEGSATGGTRDDASIAESDNISIDSNRNKSSQADNSSLMSRSTLVVVHSGEEQVVNIEADPLFQRLNEIPIFLPIMDNLSKRFPWSKSDPQELKSKLDTQSIIKIGQVYNGFIKKHSIMMSRNQVRLMKRIKQVDEALNKMLKTFTLRQRQYAYVALKFEQVPELSRSLSKCQKSLTEALKTAEFLNDLLPVEEKLEPFTWCGEDGTSDSFNLNAKEEKPMSVDRWD